MYVNVNMSFVQIFENPKILLLKKSYELVAIELWNFKLITVVVY